MAGMAFSIFESVMFDPFCNIESYHYTKKFNNKLKIQRIKGIIRKVSGTLNFLDEAKNL